MGLTSSTFLWFCIGLAVLAPVATVLLWPRAGGPRLVRGLQRLGLIGLCQVTAVVLLGVVVNNNFYLYASWNDLLGTGGTSAVGADGILPTASTHEARTVRKAFTATGQPGKGVILDQTIKGTGSGLSENALIYLPPEYNDPNYARTRFPVALMFPGYPGDPRVWTTLLPIPTVMSQEVAAGRAKPFIAVFVSATVAPPRDTECADVVNGPKVETFLAQDVRARITKVLRVRTDRKGWALMGSSLGGFCAVKMAMRHPDLYASAVSLSGFYHALQDNTTGSLYGGNRARQNQNSPLWRLAHLPAPPISVLATISKQERTYPESQQFFAAVKPPMTLQTVVRPTGGHNPGAYRSLLGPAIDFMSKRFTS